MTCAVAQSSQSPRSIAAMPFTLPPVLPCEDVALALAAATGKFNIRTQEPIAPTLCAVTRGGYTALWLGPDEYLVIGDAPPPFAAHSIVDVSHGMVAFRITGPRAAWCLNAFCGLDLDAVPANFCTRTLFGKAEVILWYLGAAEFHIETARSYAPYVWALLGEARREFLPATAAC
jgi:heterotetrameric sarcosine oxidase gamma subunit